MAYSCSPGEVLVVELWLAARRVVRVVKVPVTWLRYVGKPRQKGERSSLFKLSWSNELGRTSLFDWITPDGDKLTW